MLFKFARKKSPTDKSAPSVPMSIEERIRLAQFSSWVFTGIGSFFLVLNFFFILTLYQMGNRLTVLVQLITFARDSETLVIPDDLNERIASLDLVNEAIVRAYITKRYEVVPDKLEMMRRWSGRGEIYYLSSRPVYQQFLNRKKLDDKVNTAVSGGPVAVDIKKVSRAGSQNWIVEFDMMKSSGEIETIIASLRLVNNPGRIVYRPWFNNPVGATVVEYKAYPKKNV